MNDRELGDLNFTVVAVRSLYSLLIGTGVLSKHDVLDHLDHLQLSLEQFAAVTKRKAAAKLSIQRCEETINIIREAQ